MYFNNCWCNLIDILSIECRFGDIWMDNSRLTKIWLFCRQRQRGLFSNFENFSKKFFFQISKFFSKFLCQLCECHWKLLENHLKQTNRFPDMTHGTVALISGLFDLSGGIFVFIKMIYDSNLGIRSVFKQYSWSVRLLARIPTVKLKIPGKAFLKSESRTSVTFKL